jgi:predicted DNA-binding protein (MmcQ/YjbR family)
MMEELHTYCKSKREAVLEYPFGPDAAVMKVAGKMFALLSGTGKGGSISLKCDPVIAENLRQQYVSVVPGYHLNKKHWNTVKADGSIPIGEIRDMIDHSYEQVVKGLPKAERIRLTT